MRYWEDFVLGEELPLGSHSFSREAIVDFATAWDPQPMHTDPEAAKHSAFGGLIAAGLHTISVCMRLFVEGLLLDSAAMGSPGLQDVRWRAPVRPGDTLSLVVRVVELQPSSSRADRGTVVFDWEATNQQGVTVLTMRTRGLFGRRDPAAPGSPAP